MLSGRCASVAPGSVVRQYVAMTSEDEIFNAIINEIDQRLEGLQSGAPAVSPGETVPTTEQIEAQIAELHEDRSEAAEHASAQGRVVGGNEPALSGACDEPRPCSHLRALGAKYVPGLAE